MRRIIITAILTVICAVGAVTSFAVNDLPNFGEWMKTNEQQFRKPPKYDRHDKYMDKHMKDGKGLQVPQDGRWPQNGQPVPPNGQMIPQGQNGQVAPQSGQVPPQGQPLPGGQPNGNVPQQPTGQDAPQTTQNQ